MRSLGHSWDKGRGQHIPAKSQDVEGVLVLSKACVQGLLSPDPGDCCSPQQPLPVARLGKNLSAMQEIWVQFLSLEDPLEKGMASQSSTLAWRIPWTEALVGYSPWGRSELDPTEVIQHSARTRFTSQES